MTSSPEFEPVVAPAAPAAPGGYRSDVDVVTPELAGEAPYRPGGAAVAAGGAAPDPADAAGEEPLALGAEPDGAGEALDVVDLLVTDHRKVTDLLDRVGAEADPVRRRDLVDVVVGELTRHLTAERQCLYPAVRRHLDDGDRVADRGVAECTRIERLLREVLRPAPDDDAADRRLAGLGDAVGQHVVAAETELYPRLRRACDHQTLVDLGTRVLCSEGMAPTRPHPAAPDHPLLNKVTVSLAGLADRAADALSDRPTRVEELTDRDR